jgi:two-component system chemotaxis response regulator CheB
MSQSALPGELSTTPWIVTIAASAGGIQAIRTILSALPSDFPASVVIVQHRMPGREELINNVLRGRSLLQVTTALDGDALHPGTVYVARADSHLTIGGDKTFHYHDGTRIRHVRSSANPLFESAARVFDGHLIAVVLSGGGSDATDGVQGVKAHGGIVIAQDEATSTHWHMPKAAIASGAVDFVLPVEAIAPMLDAIVHGRTAPPVVGSSS